jgi:hypothetical protein
VVQANGGLFQSFYVQVDNRGRTIPAKHFYDTGNYRICGLGEGEWGIAVYAVNNKPTTPAEQVRNGAIYRISVDGPSCPFETYPNFPNGIRISGNTFAISGGVFHPVTGGNPNHVVSVSGTFVSGSLANGVLAAQLDGTSCANATWSARK